jgi:hypothetical protein
MLELQMLNSERALKEYLTVIHIGLAIPGNMK